MTGFPMKLVLKSVIYACPKPVGKKHARTSIRNLTLFSSLLVVALRIQCLWMIAHHNHVKIIHPALIGVLRKG